MKELKLSLAAAIFEAVKELASRHPAALEELADQAAKFCRVWEARFAAEELPQDVSRPVPAKI